MTTGSSRGAGLPPEVVRPAVLARALRNPLRRLALAVVLERPAPVSVAVLARAVVDSADGTGEAPAPSRVRVALHHRHLPLLAAANLVRRPDDGDLVRPGESRLRARLAIDPARLRRDDARWDALAAVFGQPRRRAVVAVLRRLGAPTELERLARAVAAERIGDLDPEAPVIDDLATRFHHVDLPLLDDAAVLVYDATDRRIPTVSTPEFPVPVGPV